MKTIVITPGDPAGIGPEVTAKALLKLESKLKKSSILIFGSRNPFHRYPKILRAKNISFIEPPIHPKPGFQAGWSIEQATQLVLSSPKDHVLITGPIHKQRLNDGGYRFQGHTDFLGMLCDSPHPTMMLANSHFRVSLVTQHNPISQVSTLMTERAVLKTIGDTARFLSEQLKIKKPKIAVLGLNPHAGEEGLLGFEETKIIAPAIKKAKAAFPKVTFSGPHSADSFFSLELKRKKSERNDAIIAMYHDQGLIPIKLFGFHESINLTLGLPIVRTSVDHGTAFDIAGKNKANPDSMILAIESALEFLRSKK